MDWKAGSLGECTCMKNVKLQEQCIFIKQKFIFPPHTMHTKNNVFVGISFIKLVMYAKHTTAKEKRKKLLIINRSKSRLNNCYGTNRRVKRQSRYIYKIESTEGRKVFQPTTAIVHPSLQ